jgi:hypothetical protein
LQFVDFKSWDLSPQTNRYQWKQRVSASIVLFWKWTLKAGIRSMKVSYSCLGSRISSVLDVSSSFLLSKS